MKKVSLTLFSVVLIAIYLICPANAEILKASVSDSTGVVGLDMIVGKEPVPVINDVFGQSPAQKAGMKAGDRIVAIDNKATYGLNRQQVDYAISDIPGTVVNFTVIRGQKMLNFEVMVVPVHVTPLSLQNQYLFY